MKIYNKVILEWSEETQNYDKVVYEDSYEYDGELSLGMPMPCDWNLYDFEGKVIWLVFFDSNNYTSFEEAEVVHYYYDIYHDQGLTVAAVGDFSQNSYTCQEWGDNHQQGYLPQYPILEDSQDNIYSLFDDAGPPYHVIIDHNMQVVFSSPGTILDPSVLTPFVDALIAALDEL